MRQHLSLLGLLWAQFPCLLGPLGGHSIRQRGYLGARVVPRFQGRSLAGNPPGRRTRLRQ